MTQTSRRTSTAKKKARKPSTARRKPSPDTKSRKPNEAPQEGKQAKESASFKFVTFSRRQMQLMTWWKAGSPYADYNGVIADGAIRTGKTLCGSMSFIFWAMSAFDGYNFAFCGKTIGAIHRNVLTPQLIVVLRNHGYTVVEKHKDGSNFLVITFEGRTNNFYMFGGIDKRSQDLIQGITLAGVFFDEVALQPEEFVNQATGRCSVEGSKFFFNCNPAERLHWFKVGWINKYVEKKLLYIHFTMDDNNALSETMRARYRSMYVGVFYRRYIEGLWCAAEGVIYGDAWDEVLNSYTQEEGADTPWARSSARRYVAIDYGTTNPTVFLDAYDDGQTFWIAREYYQDSRKEQRQLTPSQHADALDEFLGGDHTPIIIVDPAAEAFRLELRNRGFRVKEAKNDVLEGIRLTSTMLVKRRVRVEKSCTNFRAEVESYVWDEKAVQRGEEKPVKERDHAMDALRYLCFTIVSRGRLLAA